MEKKAAFISGATCGLGAAFARHFARQGYNLIITGHPNDRISLELEALKEKNKVDIELILADLADENDIAGIEDVIKKNDSIEVVVNNAGFIFHKPFWQKDIMALESMIKVHIGVPVRFIHAALPNMVRNGRGVIISMSSLAAFMPIPQDSMYSATKLFNISFMESLHVSVRNKGIKVQVLCPGFIRNTNFHERAGFDLSNVKSWELMPWMDPEQVVRCSIRNLKKKNKVVVVPGWGNRVIKFMVTVMPRPVYYLFATKFLQ